MKNRTITLNDAFIWYEKEYKQLSFGFFINDLKKEGWIIL
jgi:hypothetical protein